MKKLILILSISLSSFGIFSQSVGINETGTSPHATALLDVATNTKGVLIPRLTLSERNNINAPANSLLIYNTDCGVYNYFDCDTWREINERFYFPNMHGNDDVINGNATPSENENGVVYMTPPIDGAAPGGYTWTVPTGASIISGQGTNSIVVNYTTPGMGYVCVSVVNTCGSKIQSCRYINICPLPQVIGLIAGNASPNENSTGNTYSIASVPDANDYTWTVPAGAVISGGQGTNSITVDFPNAIVAEDICVVANSDCGTGSPVCISITTQCPVPVAPIVSAGSNINATDFDANWNSVSGAISYYLDVATDASFTSFVAGFQNLNVGNVTTYNVIGLTCEVDYWYRVRAENACGSSGDSGVENVTMGGCCPGSIVSVSNATLHRTWGVTHGSWMEDPLETLGAGKIWAIAGYDDITTIYEYNSLSDLINNNIASQWNLSLGNDGTGAVVYGGYLYYNKTSTRNMIKYDLASRTVVLDVVLPNAGYRNTYDYQWGGFSDIDFAVDESGLWVIYATSSNSGKIVVSKLNTSDLSIIQTWNTNSATKGNVGNAFMICGVLYTTASYGSSNTTINYKYDTNTSTGTSLSIPFTNPGGYNSMIDYNPKNQLLYSWDSGRLQRYTITF